MGYTLLFDADCCFCAGFARWVSRRDSRHQIELVPFQDERSKAIVPDPEKLHASFHLAGPGSELRSGAEALPELARLTLGRPAGVLFSVLPKKVLKWSYRWVSERRW